ncbi:Ig-like domain-containing protein [Acetobacterium woodii]|uniref:Putative cell surface protein n=1 Tax=Acetobacterium woodii (strain ATCC 29683 / DSM 1030 / JCM 2381 / KCTC 1655 / WB1) TaxID=931626 RepID=H6LIQ2_ACEWD|nr:Ig-like domain-containing protein [Acetobacterium woodii]AFA49791.1 putative cell surface protein [Acetobacterium woodii DSM 1030]
MKHKLIKKIVNLGLLVVLVLTANMTTLIAKQTELPQKSVTISVEKLTLQGGFILEPTLVAINDGENLESILTRTVRNGLIWRGEGLAAIVGAQDRGDSVPATITAMDANTNGELAPTSASLNEIGLISPGQLGEQDYSTMSAWMCSINNQLIGSEMAGYIPEAGDVIRVQFSLWGNGADLGQPLSGNVSPIDTANKDQLLEALAQLEMSPYFNQLIADSTFGAIYNQAMSIAADLQASQEAVDGSVEQLKTQQPIPTESITLPIGFMEMNVAQTAGLSVSIYPENATIGRDMGWQSSNTEVAVVDEDGVVTAIGPGEAVISAVSVTGDLRASCQVKVKAIPMTGMTINLDQLALEKQGTYLLSVCFFPDNTTDSRDLLWSSSDNSVVEVTSSGLVTAIAKGTATITAQTVNNIQATCQVTVATAQELADNITAKINNLPEIRWITLADKVLLEQVKDEYEASPQNAKNRIDVTVTEKLAALVERMTELEYNQAQADQLIEAIRLLPDADQISLLDEGAVLAARSFYESELTEEQRALVPEEVFAKLKVCEKKIIRIKRSNERAAKIVMATIADLPQATTLTLEDAKQIASARKDFEGLTAIQQGLVENDVILDNLELQINDLMKQLATRIDAQSLKVGSPAFDYFLRLGKAYDYLTESEKKQLDTVVNDKILKLQETVKSLNQSDNDLIVEVPWYVSLQAKKITATQITYTKFIERMKKEKTDPAEAQLIKLYALSLKDMSNYNTDYKFAADQLMTVSLPLSKDERKYNQLKIVTQDKGGMMTVIDQNQYMIVDNRIEFKTKNVVLVGLIGENTALKTSQSISTEQINTLKPEITTAITKTSDYMLVAAANPTIESGLWETVCFARGGYAVPEGYYELFYNNVVKELEAGNGTISGDRTNTDYSKTIIALTAIGKDPTNVGGYNLLSKLANYTQIKRGGMMAYVWALIALDSNNYEIPLTTTGIQTTRELLIQTILDREVVTSSGVRGGFSLYADSADAEPDTDVTAMTLQALAKYQDREDVKVVIDRAVQVLAGLQNDNGSYGTFGAPETSESTAQVILALTALGIDPETDARFIKNDHWVISDLMTYYVDGGGFMHIKTGGTGNGGGEPGTLNGMASYQAMQAMISYNRMKNGQPWIFGITDGFKAVINKETNLDDIQNEYEKRFGTSKTGGNVSANGAGGNSATGNSSGGSVSATAASKGGAAKDSFTPWSFNGTYQPKSKTEGMENSDDLLMDQNNGPLIFGGVVIFITGAAGLTLYIIKKKRIKSA